MMAIAKRPRQRMYWLQHTWIPAIAYTMSVKRFVKIKKVYTL